MRFQTIILSALMLLSTIVEAQNSQGRFKDSVYIDYDFQCSQYQSIYHENPSALVGWNYDNWSFIGAEFTGAKGNFRNPQKYSNLSNLDIKTESIYKIDESGWIFHGMFRYSNGTVDSVHTNLSYNIPSTGTPYYLFMAKSGVWNLQNYEFNVSAAKELGKSFSIGAKIIYNGDLAFRRIDTRNNQTSLISGVTLAGGYKLNLKNTLSIGVNYNRVKTEPTLSNKYHHETTSLIYNRYLNAGLGTYIKNISDYKIKIEDVFKGVLAHWLYHSGDNKYSLLYKMGIGEENYYNKRETSIEVENLILKYKYLSHTLDAFFIHKWEDKYINIAANSKLIKGEGNQWIESSASYLANYQVDLLNIDMNATLYQPNSILRKVSVITGLEKEERLDKNYGYQFNYTNFSAGLSAQLSVLFKKGEISLESGGVFKKNIDNTNSPNAATSNIYTTWIAYPTMSYLSSDFITFPSQIKYEIPLRNYFLEFTLHATIIKPLKINSPTGAMFTVEDNFCFYGLSTKFYF